MTRTNRVGTDNRNNGHQPPPIFATVITTIHLEVIRCTEVKPASETRTAWLPQVQTHRQPVIRPVDIRTPCLTGLFLVTGILALSIVLATWTMISTTKAEQRKTADEHPIIPDPTAASSSSPMNAFTDQWSRAESEFGITTEIPATSAILNTIETSTILPVKRWPQFHNRLVFSFPSLKSSRSKRLTES